MRPSVYNRSLDMHAHVRTCARKYTRTHHTYTQCKCLYSLAVEFPTYYAIYQAERKNANGAVEFKVQWRGQTVKMASWYARDMFQPVPAIVLIDIWLSFFLILKNAKTSFIVVPTGSGFRSALSLTRNFYCDHFHLCFYQRVYIAGSYIRPW